MTQWLTQLICSFQGWSAGQNGPSFLDFQLITNTTLDKAVAFMTGGTVGYLTGSVIAGFLSRRVNGQLLLVFACLGFGLLSIVKPWCSIYEVMILVNVFCGVAGGIQDTGESYLHKYSFC